MIESCGDDDDSEDVSKMKPFCKWATERYQLYQGVLRR